MPENPLPHANTSDINPYPTTWADPKSINKRLSPKKTRKGTEKKKGK